MVKRKSEQLPPAGLRGRRAVQAEQTRVEILRAARRQFAANGYAATSVKEIAAQAGVSMQTVYDSVGSKADLVRRLNDLIDVEAGVGEIAMAIPTTTDPLAVARVPAMITRRIVERCGDILRACLDGARADPDLAHVVDEGGRRHRAGARAVTERLAELDALDGELSTDEAAVTIATIADHRVALLLLDDHGYTPDSVEEWIATTTARAVLRPDVVGCDRSLRGAADERQ
jgi:AcrR family transcriptional regulator